MDNLDSIREALLQAMEEQRAADLAANETNYRLGQQQINYAADTRGTLYSGQPTWERAQLAASNLANIAKINSNYLDKRVNVWDSITDTLDRINSYNKAAAAMNQAAKNVSSTSGTTAQSFLDFYNQLKGEQ